MVTLRNKHSWEDFDPPFHLIAMTQREVDEYAFITKTGAVRLI
ncbi:hypothetical protein [Streptomyces durhamensis]|nr:hypothetical protein [Streptomyces durhamensis]